MIPSGTRKKHREPDHAGQDEQGAGDPVAEPLAGAPGAPGAAGRRRRGHAVSLSQRSVYSLRSAGCEVGQLDQLVEDLLGRVQPRVLGDQLVDERQRGLVRAQVADVVAVRGADLGVEVEVDPQVRGDRVLARPT